jgi:hypothetical protein
MGLSRNASKTIDRHRASRAFGIVELARAIGVSPGFLRLEIARGNLQPTRLGRRILITSAELERYLVAGSERRDGNG